MTVLTKKDREAILSILRSASHNYAMAKVDARSGEEREFYEIRASEVERLTTIFRMPVPIAVGDEEGDEEQDQDEEEEEEDE